MMTLEQLANLGELIGGLAVVASLIYLAIQVRQNTANVRSATLAANTDIWASMLAQFAQPEFNEAYILGSSGKPDLKPHQLLQFYLISRAIFVAFENQHYQFLKGTLDEEIYLGYERSTRNQILSLPGFQAYWHANSEEFSPEFVSRVNELIREVTDSDPGRLLSQWQEQPLKVREKVQESP